GEVATPEPDAHSEELFLLRRERLAVDLPRRARVHKLAILPRARVEEQLLGEDHDRPLLHGPAPLIAPARVAGRRDHRAQRWVSQEDRYRFETILVGVVALVLRLAVKLVGR